MVARMETSLGNNMENGDSARPTLYLGSLSYDGYTGRGWISRRTQEKEYSPGDLLSVLDQGNTYQVRQQIQFVEEGDGVVYTVGEPLSIDQDFLAAWRIFDPQSGIYDLFGVIVSGETYRADSLVRIYSEEELRAAGQDYPAWLLDRYLQLPDS